MTRTERTARRRTARRRRAAIAATVAALAALPVLPSPLPASTAAAIAYQGEVVVHVDLVADGMDIRPVLLGFVRNARFRYHYTVTRDGALHFTSFTAAYRTGFTGSHNGPSTWTMFMPDCEPGLYRVEVYAEADDGPLWMRSYQGSAEVLVP